jgi:hypothetical protein
MFLLPSIRIFSSFFASKHCTHIAFKDRIGYSQVWQIFQLNWPAKVASTTLTADKP